MPAKNPFRIEQYDHQHSERSNNPPVGLVTPKTDPDIGVSTQFQFDPDIDPQLEWASKAERTSFEIPLISLHVHERIDPKTIIQSVMRDAGGVQQTSIFEEFKPLREAVEFYKHKDNWSNRLIAGDSLLVMNSLLNKEAMSKKVQMIYVDPPYGIRYRSNFQPFVNKQGRSDDNDNDLTSEPEMIKAFRDTWELGIHSYLSYLRDRLLLARELLHESGSIFLQIGDENVHRVSMVMDEIFGAENRIATITFATTSSSSTNFIPEVADYLIWYAKDKSLSKYHQLYEQLSREEIIDYFTSYVGVELSDKTVRKITDEERFDPNRYLPNDARIYSRVSLTSQGASTTGRSDPFVWNGHEFKCDANRHWSISFEGLNKLAELGRLEALPKGKSLRWKRYEDEVPGRKISNVWNVIMPILGSEKRYVVQTAKKVIQRCMLMCTDPGDLVLDITCGSGTTAVVAEQWGRRWITCDTSRVALTLAKQRLMTSVYDYYRLANSAEGVSGGFSYRTVPTVSPSTLAAGEEILTTIYDDPTVERKNCRVTGPFTIEAVPAPYNKRAISLDTENIMSDSPDIANVRIGETIRRNDWRDELLRTGIRGKHGQRIKFTRAEAIAGMRYLHAEAETEHFDHMNASNSVMDPNSRRIIHSVISFGPEHAPLEQRQVENALQEAALIRPNPPEMIIFVAFQFDPEAAKDIDETNWPGVTLLKVQMNTDLQTQDLKKNQTDNESFWLIGQPDIELQQIQRGRWNGKWQVILHGFDYFDVRDGKVMSGDKKNIALWMLDTDYDERSLFPRQVFFPMAGTRDGWNNLSKNLKNQIDQNSIEAYRGTISLPFDLGINKRVAVKVVDDRGIESFRVISIYD